MPRRARTDEERSGEQAPRPAPDGDDLDVRVHGAQPPHRLCTRPVTRIASWHRTVLVTCTGAN